MTRSCERARDLRVIRTFDKLIIKRSAALDCRSDVWDWHTVRAHATIGSAPPTHYRVSYSGAGDGERRCGGFAAAIATATETNRSVSAAFRVFVYRSTIDA